ncbi:tetratricopeptide repeat domain protein [Sporothrix schenckii 1099-18]|uniref:Tetratricopeptide repeat domain protein n=1 Tax=Sporothrix schenckii 1099-18 TaxID=1397361 RepID=A0A0F2LZ05_SPOSC|nr:tetratricopeptide repeat domain protein [Sporothrix schenckii 1099-18]KJR82059.1 tetratricopeptide repeat domain protein [Sporothrix schenckii 1099-18]
MADNYYDLGDYALPVSTTSADAQLWFNRGLRWAFAFNHEEAVRCFRKATDHDPRCVMAYWGIAYARGPNYNKAWVRFDRSDLQRAFAEAIEALAHAVALQEQGAPSTPREKAVVEALRQRFPDDPAAPASFTPETLGQLDERYVVAMRNVYKAFPDDLEVAGLLTEALMCVSPRRLWDLSTGEPLYHTTEARAVLEPALAKAPAHPMFCHLYIHLMEMSPFPEIALPAANTLRTLMPQGSHMLHMPTHIDAAVGDYQNVVDSNHRAMVADDAYFAQQSATSSSSSPPPVLYHLYRIHNVYVKCYGAIISGQSQAAIDAATTIQTLITPALLSIKSPPMADWVESIAGAMAHALIRFGRWEAVLQWPLPADQDLFASTTAMVYYARGIAYAVTGRIAEAEEAQTKFEAARLRVPPTRLNALPVLEKDVLLVAQAMLAGELAYRKGRVEDAFQHLRAAVAAEDQLPYSDPPSWMQPARHALGALLLEQGRTDEAEQVYRDDLGFGNLPRRKARINNVWALHGLCECLEKNGKTEQLAMLRIQRDTALALADIPLHASCYCRLTAFPEGEHAGAAKHCC